MLMLLCEKLGEGGGNWVSVELVLMGVFKVSFVECFKEINVVIICVKDKGCGM